MPNGWLGFVTKSMGDKQPLPSTLIPLEREIMEACCKAMVREKPVIAGSTSDTCSANYRYKEEVSFTRAAWMTDCPWRYRSPRPVDESVSPRLAIG